MDRWMMGAWMDGWTLDRWMVGGWVNGKMTGWGGKCFIRIHILATENGGKPREVRAATPPTSL